MYAHLRQFGKAKSAFLRYEKYNYGTGKTARNWAVYYALKGKKSRALTYLKKAIRRGYNNIKFLEKDKSLRKEEAFKKLLQQVREQVSKKE